MPPTYGIDTYTGKNVMIEAGYHVQNKSLEVTIMNQFFTPFKNKDGDVITLWYDVRWKGHYGDYWVDTNSSGNSLT